MFQPKITIKKINQVRKDIGDYSYSYSAIARKHRVPIEKVMKWGEKIRKPIESTKSPFEKYGVRESILSMNDKEKKRVNIKGIVLATLLGGVAILGTYQIYKSYTSQKQIINKK